MDYLNLFRDSKALLTGHFILSSGLHSNTYFQCAKALQYPANLSIFCKPIAEHFSKFEIDAVISPAIGGLAVGTEIGRLLNVKTIFAERQNSTMCLRRGFEISNGEKFLVVEDVVTTGGSVKEVIDIVTSFSGKVAGVGFIVDRSNGNVILSENQFSLISLKVETFSPSICPLCKQGDLPAEKPGSRSFL